jgi:hypothetical protein
MKTRLVLGVALIPALAFARSTPQPVAAQPVLLDVDTKFPTRFAGRCWVAKRLKGEKEKGGPSESAYLSRLIGKMPVKQGELYLEALPDQPTVLKTADKRITYKGMTLLVVNATGSRQQFWSDEGRLTIRQEALDEQGHWQIIEYWLGSGCGNAYRKVLLGPNEYWSFAVPRYTGTFKTKLRFRFSRNLGYPSPFLLSNEFEGSVNPEQFLGRL